MLLNSPMISRRLLRRAVVVYAHLLRHHRVEKGTHEVAVKRPKDPRAVDEVDDATPLRRVRLVHDGNGYDEEAHLVMRYERDRDRKKVRERERERERARAREEDGNIETGSRIKKHTCRIIFTKIRTTVLEVPE